MSSSSAVKPRQTKLAMAAMVLRAKLERNSPTEEARHLALATRGSKIGVEMCDHCIMQNSHEWSRGVKRIPSHAVAGQTVGDIHNAFHGEATSHLPANQPTIQRHRDHFGSGEPRERRLRSKPVWFTQNGAIPLCVKTGIVLGAHGVSAPETTHWPLGDMAAQVVFFTWPCACERHACRRR